MKTVQPLICMLCLIGLSSLAVSGETITLTAETDRAILTANEKQTVFLRVGLTGCDDEFFKERRPVNVAIVIDKSGSMSGEKIEKAKEAAITALYRLSSNDIASVIVYDNEAQVLVPATKMTQKESIARQIRQIRADGSTALYDGVQTGAEEIRKFMSKNTVNRLVLLSDGLANIGPDSPSDLGRLGANLADEGVSVTTIGLGLGYNEDLMSQLAIRSDGGHYFAEDADELADVFEREFGRAMSVVAQQVHLEIICGEGLRPVRILGREGTIDDRTVELDIQNIYSNHEKYVLVEVEVPAHGKDETRELACVRMNYQDLKTQSSVAKAGQACRIRFTASKDEADKSVNSRVASDVIEQIAIENNQRALALRDKGQIRQAQTILMENADYLNSNANRLNSQKLASYAAENTADADHLEEQNWTRQRKSMRESQSSRQTQR